MKYLYVGDRPWNDEDIDRFKQDASVALKKWLEYIIFSEQPYLADNLHIPNADEETLTLLALCRYFSAVLRDEVPERFPFFIDAGFEDYHHGLTVLSLNFLANLHKKKTERSKNVNQDDAKGMGA